MKTKERLAAALRVHDVPPRMIADALDGYYDDYESPLAFPLHQLVRDLEAIGLKGLAQRVKDGEFDGTKEEADAWARRNGLGL